MSLVRLWLLQMIWTLRFKFDVEQIKHIYCKADFIPHKIQFNYDIKHLSEFML